MRKVLIIGAGGIGSFLIPLLDMTDLYAITVYDPDRVETKNLTYQNFVKEDVGKYKVAVMNERYNLKSAEPYPILTKNQIQKYELVVCCADNLAVRKMLYKDNCGEDAPVKWLDLRAQGRNAALLSYKIDAAVFDTVLAGPEGSFSCQGGEWDGSGEGVNCMHMAIAGCAAQWIQKWFNDKDDVVDKMVMNI